MDATVQSTEFVYSPNRWEESIIAERFLYPLCRPDEAQMLRAFGRFLFYRCLEYSGIVDRGESRVVSDLRGAARDLRLLERFVHAVGNSFDMTEVRLEDRSFVLKAAEISPKLTALADDIEDALPPPLVRHPDEPMTPARRKVLERLRVEWSHASQEATDKLARATEQLEEIDGLLGAPEGK
jgi:hypothetical protein